MPHIPEGMKSALSTAGSLVSLFFGASTKKTVGTLNKIGSALHSLIITKGTKETPRSTNSPVQVQPNKVGNTKLTDLKPATKPTTVSWTEDNKTKIKENIKQITTEIGKKLQGKDEKGKANTLSSFARGSELKTSEDIFKRLASSQELTEKIVATVSNKNTTTKMNTLKNQSNKACADIDKAFKGQKQKLISIFKAEGNTLSKTQIKGKAEDFSEKFFKALFPKGLPQSLVDLGHTNETVCKAFKDALV